MLERIKTFLETPSLLPKIIVIYGPTGSGKTRMSIDVAKEIGTLSCSFGAFSPFIVSADSRQIYQGLDIGTGKVTTSEMQDIPHYGFDLIGAHELYSVVAYREGIESLDTWKDWQMGAKNLIPIICGGTGLYIDSLIYERSYPNLETDWGLRNELESFRIEHGNEVLWNRLHDLDPIYAETLHKNNTRYIIRAIEVITKTGSSKSLANDGQKLRYDTLFLTPYTDSPENRKALYERSINPRVQHMFSSGLIEEVGYTIKKFSKNCPGLTTIGYREVVEHLEGLHTLEETIDLVSQYTRNYAKRQITWNRKYEQSIQ